jgi:opacity protein-like surface antigen
MLRGSIAVAFICTLLALSPASAGAQTTFITPYAGATFGADAPDSQFTFGGSLTFMGDVAGVEIDFGYTPDFFDASDEFEIVGDSNVTTFIANLVVGPWAGRVRPYGVVGVGLLRSSVDGGDLFDDVSTNDFGFDAGFGVIGMVSENVGLRGDVRYFRSLQDTEDDDDFDVSVGNFDFWRATGGVVFGF